MYNVDFYDPNYDKYSLITDTSTVNINRSDTSVNLRIPFDKTTRVHVHLWFPTMSNTVTVIFVLVNMSSPAVHFYYNQHGYHLYLQWTRSSTTTVLLYQYEGYLMYRWKHKIKDTDEG